MRIVTCMRTVIVAGMLLIPTLATGQVTASRGAATFTFGPAVCGTVDGVDKTGAPIKQCRQPTPLDFQEAQRRAALNAVERFVAEGGESQAQAFERVRDSVRTRFDEIIMTVAELNRSVDENTRQITMAVRIDINEAKLRNLMQATSSIATSGGAKSLVGMFLLAREQASVESFGAERRASSSTKSTDSSTRSSAVALDSARKAKEAESLKGGTVVLDDKVESSNSSASKATNTTDAAASSVESSSTVERAAKVQYSVAPAQDLDGVLGGRLSAAGYETVESAFFEDDTTPALVDAVRADFGTGDDLKASTLRRIAAAALKQSVKFVLIGTVDTSLPDKDPVTGSPRVIAKASAKVYDVSGRLPRTVVNVGPAQFAGTGPSAGAARTNALKEAVEQIAKAIIDQLSNKQVR